VRWAAAHPAPEPHGADALLDERRKLAEWATCHGHFHKSRWR
jgi:hypothetical protein